MIKALMGIISKVLVNSLNIFKSSLILPRHWLALVLLKADLTARVVGVIARSYLVTSLRARLMFI